MKIDSFTPYKNVPIFVPYFLSNDLPHPSLPELFLPMFSLNHSFTVLVLNGFQGLLYNLTGCFSNHRSKAYNKNSEATFCLILFKSFHFAKKRFNNFR